MNCTPGYDVYHEHCLPMTGSNLDLIWLALIAIALIASGFLVRWAAKEDE